MGYIDDKLRDYIIAYSKGEHVPFRIKRILDDFVDHIGAAAINRVYEGTKKIRKDDKRELQ